MQQEIANKNLFFQGYCIITVLSVQ